MKIGIIGSGTVGMTLAEKFVAAGHEVHVANRRGPESLRDQLSEVEPRPISATVADACASEIVFLAIPWVSIRDVLTPDIAWDGRILVDTTNIFLSYAPEFEIDDLKGDSGSEVIARLAPTARTVKAFNTLPFEKLFASHSEGMRRVLFVAGDDTDAVETISRLIRELNLHPVSLGQLATGGRLMELTGPFSNLELLHPTE